MAPSAEMLCRRAAAHWRDGAAEAAVVALRAAQVDAPHESPAYLNLGMVLREGRALAAAAICLRRAIRIAPERDVCWLHYALVRAATGGEAAAARVAAAIAPDRAETYGLIADGVRAEDAGSAVTTWRYGLRIEPHRRAWTTNLVAALLSSGRPAEAVAAARGASDGAAGDPIRLINLSAALLALDDDAGAAAAAAAAALQMPDDRAPWRNRLLASRYVGSDRELGRQIHRQGLLVGWPCDAGAGEEFTADMVQVAFGVMVQERFAEARQLARRALALAPADGKGWSAIASIHQRVGEAETAVARLDRALACLAAAPGDAATRRSMGRRSMGRARLAALLSCATIDPERFLLAHLDFTARHHVPITARLPAPAPVLDPDRPLRVGYVSSDWHDQHPAARQFLPILFGHDQASFPVTCYAAHRRIDETTRAVRSVAAAWRAIGDLDDRAAAELVRADRIDILVILAGRFDANRPLIAGYRPAPVQVSYFDEATLGSVDFDYGLSDARECPGDTPEWYVERVFRLPASEPWLAPDMSLPAAIPVHPPGLVTFGCFCSPAKLTDATLDLWARVLAAVSGSRLVLRYRRAFGDPLVSARVLSAMARRGVAADRIVLGTRRETIGDHLAGYAEIDVALDTWPFNGVTTTRNALSMGVPVVTLAGWRRSARRSAGMLRSVGRDDLVARTTGEFVEIARRLAHDDSPSAQRRSALRAAFAAAPRADHRRFTRHLERAYRAMWRRWCALQGGR